MSDKPSRPLAYGQPTPKAHSIPYKAPPESKNPVVRGALLNYGSGLVASSPTIARYLYNNAGFSQLRTLDALNDFETRYNPAVIPAQSEGEAFDLTRIEHDRAETLRTPLGYPSVLDYHQSFKSKSLTPLQVAKAILAEIKSNSKHAPAFLDVQSELVLAAAEASTKRYEQGTQFGILDGIPVAVKDQVDIKGYKTTFGMNKDLAKGETSWCVQQWLDAGAVCIGKVTMHELGLDTTNNNPNHGTPRNPFNSSYYTGGSSGGSGYVVGCGICPIALGADGGGSIRIPSSFCGIFGLKTTHDRVSGVPNMRSVRSTGVIGPMAANMIDLEIAYKVMAKPHPANPSSAMFPGPRQSIPSSRVKKIGICRQWFDRADRPVKDACDKALQWLKENFQYEVVDITLPYLYHGQLAHALTILHEISSYYLDRSGLTPANKVLISVGLQASAHDFLNAQKLRNVLMQHLAYLWQEHPGMVIATPTTPNIGWPIAAEADLVHGCSDGNRSIRTMEYVWLANFTGIPGLTTPVAFLEPEKGEGNIPVGLTLMGEWATEDSLIEAGYDLEKYLYRKLDGGRLRPSNWVNPLAATASTDKSL